jgi:hypothetical protein
LSLLIFSGPTNCIELQSSSRTEAFPNTPEFNIIILFTIVSLDHEFNDRALAKNGSFAFAEGLVLCVGAKANVPFVRLAKIVFKKCAMEKNKNTLGRLECRFTVSLVGLVTVIGFGLSINIGLSS